MENTEEVAGFQFKILDEPDQIEFSSVTFDGVNCSGNCIPSSWSVSGSESSAGGMNVLGFDFMGSTIGVGSGVLLHVDYVSEEILFFSIYFSNFSLNSFSLPTREAIPLSPFSNKPG